MFDPIHKNDRAFFKEGFKVMMDFCGGVMHRHSLVDISAFQWPFFSFESRDTTKWPGMLVHNYTNEILRGMADGF